MKILNQYDPRWATVKIGASNLTLAAKGCTITCCSMLSDYFFCFLTPAQIAGHKDWFTKDGLILWSKLKFNNMVFVKREYTYVPAEINAAIIEPKRAVILAINRDAHWVAATGILPLGYYRIADPYGGKRSVIHKSKISGFALFHSL